MSRSNTSTSQAGIENSQNAQPVCIAGMHRSGTSMVAKLLQKAGLSLGAASDLMPPAEENPEGFFEHLSFVRLNEEVLNAAGAGWDCPPPADVDWGREPFNGLRERARGLAAALQGDGPWGWKDPRNSLTLSFWRSALGPLRTIIVIRNPLEVVTSLHRRNGFSIALALTLWQIYGERILEASESADRLVTHYDAYFYAPERETARLLAFARLPPHTSEGVLEGALLPALRHHRKTERDLVEHGFPRDVITLYRRLCDEAEWRESDADLDAESEVPPASSIRADSITRGIGGVDLVRVENEALRRNIADFTAALAGREARIAELEIALRGHETFRAELDGKVAERDGRLEERNALIARRDHAIAALQQQIAHNAAELTRLREQEAVLTERLAASDRARVIAEIHVRELRSTVTGLQDAQYQRDSEIMATLGAVLSRHAPGAPASIYYRRLVGQLRQIVDANVPPRARTLVATYGDDELLDLGDRVTEPFPRATPGLTADYTDVSGAEAVAQIESLRGEGAEFLVVPSPALPWLATRPELEHHLETRYVPVARERGVATIFALSRQRGQIPA